MRTLADVLLAALPALMAKHPEGPMAKHIAAYIAADIPACLAAARKLDADGRAVLLRYHGSKARHLVPLGHFLGPQMFVCANCRVVFERPKKLKRVCCGRSCAIAWSWKNPATAESRKAAITAERATAEAKARTKAISDARWSRPGERERMGEWNRQRWADPAIKAQMATAIQAVNGSPEKRAEAAEIRRKLWTDPVYREKCLAAMRAGWAAKAARKQAYA